MYCQKCRTSLKLDSSLENVSPAALKLLSDASAAAQKHVTPVIRSSRPLYPEERRSLYEEVSRSSQSPTSKRSPHSQRHEAPLTASVDATAAGSKENPAMSFVMLTESQVVPSAQSQIINAHGSTSRNAYNTKSPQDSKNKDSASSGLEGDSLLSQRMETVAKLFEILSSRSDIDHPVCAECTEMLVDGMEKRLAEVTRERDAFVDFLRSANADAPTDEERRQAKKELKSLQDQEAAAFAELQELERENAVLEQELAALEIESRELDAEEEAFWQERNAYTQTVLDYQNERESITLRYEHDLRQLERLQKTNVYNDTFCISYDGSFATINGLRLGRLSSPTVEWSEINAAWGQACLLLTTVAEKLRFNFQGYRLKPEGSTSTIAKIEYMQQSATSNAPATTKPVVTALELFYSGDLPISLPFGHRKFDSAMIAFLECIRQLGKHIERNESGQKLPYEIKKDKIGEISIKLGGFGQEDWTRACKYTLTCCKYLLAYASRP